MVLERKQGVHSFSIVGVYGKSILSRPDAIPDILIAQPVPAQRAVLDSSSPTEARRALTGSPTDANRCGEEVVHSSRYPSGLLLRQGQCRPLHPAEETSGGRRGRLLLLEREEVDLAGGVNSRISRAPALTRRTTKATAATTATIASMDSGENNIVVKVAPSIPPPPRVPANSRHVPRSSVGLLREGRTTAPAEDGGTRHPVGIRKRTRQGVKRESSVGIVLGDALVRAHRETVPEPFAARGGGSRGP